MIYTALTGGGLPPTQDDRCSCGRSKHPDRPRCTKCQKARIEMLIDPEKQLKRETREALGH